MKTADCLIHLAAIMPLLCASLGLAQGTAPLTHLSQVVALTNQEANQGYHVEIPGVVTFAQPSESNLFLSDSGSGLYVKFNINMGLQPGDRVVVSGVTGGSFRPIVVASQVRFVEHGHTDPPRPALFEELIAAKWDSQLVEVTGHILSAAVDTSNTDQASGVTPGLYLHVQMAQGIVQAYIARPGNLQAEDLLESDVRLDGVAAGVFDSKLQMAGIRLDVDSDKELTILAKPAYDAWSMPATPMDRVISSYRFNNESNRVRITGLLTYYEPGSIAVLERDGKTMVVETQTALPLHPGQAVEVTGFPGVAQGTVRLVNARMRAFSEAPAIQPPTIDWESASIGRYAYNLVAMEAEVVDVVHDSRMDLFILRVDNHLFSASVRNHSSEAGAIEPGAGTAPSPVKGSLVRVTGVCFVDDGNRWRDRLWFDLRMRSLADAVVIKQPSGWSVERLTQISFLLSVLILAAIIWAGLLDRKLRLQNAKLARQSQEDAMRERTLARQEQQRSHILELISSAAPLGTVLTEIQGLVSTRLFGAPCWFELIGFPLEPIGTPHTQEKGTLSKQLHSPDGTLLGTLHATPWPNAARNPDIPAALLAGERLAELAIDTRRLYSDLRHRSEFDMLTNVPNRFSMEKHLSKLMEAAALHQTGFGMIYVDLDRFKQVNDQYGHRIGDLYLQEVVRRMKLQLREEDVLARIGGDEFIALIPVQHNRAIVEQIAMRLELCFEDPFELEGIRFSGSASLGMALYPEDGTSQEELQHAADAAMYSHKAAKRLQDAESQAMQLAWRDDLAD